MATHQVGGNALKVTYEPEYDHLSVWIGAPTIADNVEVEPGLCVRVSRATHRVVGLEVIDAARRFGRTQESLENQAYLKTLIQEYGRRVVPDSAFLAAR